MKTKTGNPKPMIKVASLFIILSLTAQADTHIIQKRQGGGSKLY